MTIKLKQVIVNHKTSIVELSALKVELIIKLKSIPWQQKDTRMELKIRVSKVNNLIDDILNNLTFENG